MITSGVMDQYRCHGPVIRPFARKMGDLILCLLKGTGLLHYLILGIRHLESVRMMVQ